MAERKPYYDVGRYWGRLKQHPIGQAKTGTPQIVLTFEIVGKVNVMDPEGDLLPCPPGHGTMFLSLTADTAEWVTPILRTLGLIGDKISVLDPSSPEHQTLVGKEIGLYCSHKAGQDGIVRENWGLAKDGGGPKVESLDAANLRKLDALFGRQLKATSAPPKKDNGKPEPQKELDQALQEAAVSDTADDVPF